MVRPFLPAFPAATEQTRRVPFPLQPPTKGHAMKTLLALLLSSALCFADAVSHAEIAESGSPAGGAGERSEPEGVPHAEPAEGAEPAAPGGDAIQHSALRIRH